MDLDRLTMEMCKTRRYLSWSKAFSSIVQDLIRFCWGWGGASLTQEPHLSPTSLVCPARLLTISPILTMRARMTTGCHLGPAGLSPFLHLGLAEPCRGSVNSVHCLHTLRLLQTKTLPANDSVGISFLDLLYQSKPILWLHQFSSQTYARNMSA